MTLNKHFLNAIYANHDAKLEKILAHGGRQSLLCSQNFHSGKNSAPEPTVNRCLLILDLKPFRL